MDIGSFPQSRSVWIGGGRFDHMDLREVSERYHLSFQTSSERTMKLHTFLYKQWNDGKRYQKGLPLNATCHYLGLEKLCPQRPTPSPSPEYQEEMAGVLL